MPLLWMETSLRICWEAASEQSIEVHDTIALFFQSLKLETLSILFPFRENFRILDSFKSEEN